MAQRVRHFGVLLGLAVVLGGGIFCLLSVAADQTKPQKELAAWWAHYKKTFISPEGRVFRPEHGGDTVSEGQAYALIYAVLLDDRDTFVRVWGWTQSHLSRKEKFGDELFAWHWQDDAVADWNSASAASLDIILALILGSRKWEDATLKTRALAIAADVLEQETAETELGLAPLPGAWSRNEEGDFVINPSYASPATFRMLYTLSRDKRWLRLVASSYEIWERTGKRVGRARGVGLPPDWCRLTKQGRFEHATGRSTAYGWDALRTPLRAGLDALLMKKKTARQYLAESQVRFFRKRLSKASPPRPAAVYAYWGAVADPTESLAMTASALFAFQAAGAKELKVLAQSFDKQRKQDMFARNYYAQSLAFYPLAFRAGIFDAVRKK